MKNNDRGILINELDIFQLVESAYRTCNKNNVEGSTLGPEGYSMWLVENAQRSTTGDIFINHIDVTFHTMSARYDNNLNRLTLQ